MKTSEKNLRNNQKDVGSGSSLVLHAPIAPTVATLSSYNLQLQHIVNNTHAIDSCRLSLYGSTSSEL